MLTLSLPVAPPANNAFINRRSGKGFGRIKSGKHRNWIAQADKYYTLQGLGRMKPVLGPYNCEMTFPNLAAGDLDGRQKLILDWLVSRKLVEGDSPEYLRRLTSLFSGEQGELVWITVREIDGQP